eukprot:6255236-Pyramimonas_sp.AAC.1
MELHRRRQWLGSHGAPPHFGGPLTRLVAPQGTPPKAPVVGFAWCPAPLRHGPHTFRGPKGSSTEGASGCGRLRPHPVSADPLHISWPQRPLTRFVAPKGARARPQWL